MAVLITGVAGFIGTNLLKSFLDKGITVYGVDNLCRGEKKNISLFLNNKLFNFLEIDISDFEKFYKNVQILHNKERIDQVWHLAANSDIPAGVINIDVDFKDTFLTTLNVLKISKILEIEMLAFASTSAIYGDLGEKEIYEDIGPLLPISNYGAMKLASEAIISASAESFLKNIYIFRFPNVIGTPATHGVILDFINKLKLDPNNLEVLGNGTQQKPYLLVEELIDAMHFIVNNSLDKINLFNIGNTDDGVSVKFIAETVVNSYSPNAKISYGIENRGWIGDVPRFKYSVEKLRKLGWSPKFNSQESICKALQQILLNSK
jgi:UDP-glucose 4-epimerase